MCFTFTKHYGCGCDVPGREESNGCGGNCTGDNITYNDDMDETTADYCPAHKPQAASPITSSESEGSAES